jgi:hypothetical protein
MNKGNKRNGNNTEGPVERDMVLGGYLVKRRRGLLQEVF